MQTPVQGKERALGGNDEVGPQFGAAVQARIHSHFVPSSSILALVQQQVLWLSHHILIIMHGDLVKMTSKLCICYQAYSSLFLGNCVTPHVCSLSQTIEAEAPCVDAGATGGRRQIPLYVACAHIVDLAS